jgi:hypothetical protein
VGIQHGEGRVMIKFDILNRFSGAVQFTAEINCDKNAEKSVKIGLAVKWALKNDADLRGADLRDAYLRGAYLRGADLRGAYLRGAYLRDAYLRGAYLRGADLCDAYLRGADLCGADLCGADLCGADLRGAGFISDRVIDGGLRSDGYRFLLARTEPGAWRIKAGCRNFTVDDGLNHWASTRPEGEALGDETRLIVAHMVSLAKLRAWPETGEEPKTEGA